MTPRMHTQEARVVTDPHTHIHSSRRMHSGQKSRKPGQNMKVTFDLYRNEYTKVFEVADCESEVKITKNKMADPIWRTRILEKHHIWSKLSILAFSRSLITHGTSKLHKIFIIFKGQDADVEEMVRKGAAVMGRVWSLGNRRSGKNGGKIIWLFDKLVWAVMECRVEMRGWKAREKVYRCRKGS